MNFLTKNIWGFPLWSLIVAVLLYFPIALFNAPNYLNLIPTAYLLVVFVVGCYAAIKNLTRK